MHSQSLSSQTAPGRDRSRRDTQPARVIMIRRSRLDDDAALQRLARLDSRPLPAGTFLLAEVGRELVAAVPLNVDEEPLADPFRPTADISELLRRSARRLRQDATLDVAA
jgi:hypothetical protein